MTGPAVVGLGGGHGLAVTLSAVRQYAGKITAVVSVADDGGSSGRLRNDFGLPAPGDIRRCLVALAADPAGPWAEAFGYRFANGDLEGHALGNLVLAALTETTGSFVAAVAEAGRLLGARGAVYPATTLPVVLTADTATGSLRGQTAVEDHSGGMVQVAIEPADARCPQQVLDALEAADQVILGPGSLFTSLLAVTAVADIREALRTKPTVFVCNLGPSKETIDFSVADHVEALRRHDISPATVLVDPSALVIGDVGDCKLVEHRLADRTGSTHDPSLLAEALVSLR